MTIDELNSLDDNAKKEICELYSIIKNNPCGIEEIKILAEWHKLLGKFGQDLKNYLIGLYPWDNYITKDDNGNSSLKIQKMIQSSDESLRVITLWNKWIHSTYDQM